MRTGLAEARWLRVRDKAEESTEWLAAAHTLVQGKHAEAERLNRDVLDVRRRVLGEEHASTLTSASNLACSLSGLGKYAEAERLNREVLDATARAWERASEHACYY